MWIMDNYMVPYFRTHVITTLNQKNQSFINELVENTTD